MANTNQEVVAPEILSDVLIKELKLYHAEVTEQVDEASKKAVDQLVKITRQTAPEQTGEYRQHLSGKLLKRSPNGSTYVWYAKKPAHRLTHLLVNGYNHHSGVRVPGDPFLRNALNTVLPDYEENVKEAIKG